MSDGSKMAHASALYQTKIMLYVSDGSGVQLVAKKDPRRYYIQTLPASGATQTLVIYPGSVPDGTIPGALAPNYQEHKFRDCPGMVTGEWYIHDTSLTSLIIVEEIYVGG